ncbi:MAG: IS1634 family transposase [Clostridiales bacterium]|jgi:transposase|nr:IS1634 family transposase [Clostridiales bacterium]
MSSITKQRIGKHTYLYESESFWDSKNKRPDNKKISIGKIDLLTGEPMYKKEYLNRLSSKGESIIGMEVWDKARESSAVIKNGYENGIEGIRAVIDSVKDFGVVYFLRKLSEKIGLLDILRDTMPKVWHEVFCWSCYLIAADEPVMYCDEWVASNEGLEAGNMSSQRVSDLLTAFDSVQRDSFYTAWHRLIREKEYIALDITSVSSYSEQINACEWGYNRDGENLPQINICMLFGEDSKLPVYQTIYSGSLRDVSTLKSTISEFAALTGDTDIMIVMDKGFYSAKNINMLQSEDEGKQRYRFLISAPFTSKFAKNQVESESKDIDRIENVILTNGSPIRGIHKLRSWSESVKLHAHVFFNPEKAVKDRNELFGYVAALKLQAVEDPDNKKLAADYKKYLNVRKSQQTLNGVTVSIRDDVVIKELETSGWFVLLSNYIEDAQTAHDVYRMKDVVEKSFLKYKNNLGLDRLRVHSDERMQNKLFIAFIALIIASAIHDTMKKKDLFKIMTFDRLILVLAKLKSAIVNGKTILRPVTKEQLLIFNSFDILSPDYSNFKSEPKKRGRKPKQKVVI